MAANTISTFTLYTPKSTPPSSSSSSSSSSSFNPSIRIPLRTQTPCRVLSSSSKNLSPRATRIRAVVDEEAAAVPESTVSVQVSPSDVLTMLFRAEGTMNESLTPSIYQALEGVEGVEDLKVQVVEGIASVELTKQTTVQATGVASGLVETIQGSGFKLQTLNLSFLDEDDMS